MNQNAQQMSAESKAPRKPYVVMGALVGAVFGGGLLFVTAGAEPGGYVLIVVGAIIGASAVHASLRFLFGGAPVDVCRRVLQVKESLMADMIAGLHVRDRRKVGLCRVIIAVSFVCALCYAAVLSVLESGHGEIYGKWLHFFAPLVGFMSDFFPRADAVRDALQEHGYEARAEFAAHIVVMTRLFCLPAVVAALVCVQITYRGGKPTRFRCTRSAYDLCSFGVYASAICLAGFALVYETGFKNGMSFEARNYGLMQYADYHRTRVAALFEAIFVVLWIAVIRQLQWHVMLSRAQPVFLVSPPQR